MELTLLTCVYNTPHLLENLLKSYQQTNKNNINLFVVDTSTKPEVRDFVDKHNINGYIELSGESHGVAVNYGLKEISTKYVLLVDSDIIFLKDIKKLYDVFVEKDLTLMGEIQGDRGGKKLHPRIKPWFCFINNFDLEEYDIEFFDENRTLQSKKEGKRIYDVGSTMFEDVCSVDNLKVGDVKIEDIYYKHYEGMSWYVEKYNPLLEDTDIDFGGTHNNISFYNYGKILESTYSRETEKFKNVKLKSFK